MVDQLRQVGVEATLNQIETAQYFPMRARRDSQIGANLTAAGIDDPDAYFYENYTCGSSRNYTDSCSEETDRLIDLQSQELDRAKRLTLVWHVQRKLEASPVYVTRGPVRRVSPSQRIGAPGRRESRRDA